MAGLNPTNLGRPFPDPSLTAGLGGLPRRPSSALSPESSERRQDILSLSPEGLQLADAASQANRVSGEAEGSDGLTEEEQKEVRQLKQRDTEVRRHEQAHVAAGGQHVQGAASLEYTRGPDGRQYATGGEVSIDVSGAGSPEATIQKARIVRRAALAPADPSPQDRLVAARASRLETEARVDLREANLEKTEEARASTTPIEQSATEPVPGQVIDPHTLDYRV